jgi:rhodanese-related sulfurtransferase
MMDLGFMTVCASVVVAAVLVKRVGDRRELERHAITPEALHALLAWNRDVLVVDVRQPLDLLGNSAIIPGAKWFVPRAVLDDPCLIPGRKDLILYCTCPGDKNSRAVLDRALAMGFSRISFLKDGLDGWRAKGYPVEPFEKPFRLDSGRNSHLTAAS